MTFEHATNFYIRKIQLLQSGRVSEQGITSHQTHYRSYRGRDFMGQMAQPTVSKHWRKNKT